VPLYTKWLEITKNNPGWWYTYPSEKYESQLRLLIPIYMDKYIYIYGTIKNVPNHQPEHQANSSSFAIPLPLWWGWTQS
jgi:hypothetical protein